MGTAILWIVIGTSLWMAYDAHQIGYDKKDVKGLAGMGPAGWLFAGLLLWIVAFPLYLANRGKLKAAAGTGALHSPGTAVSQVSSDGPAGKSLASKLGRGFVNTVYGLGALVLGLVIYVTVTQDDAENPATASAPAAAVVPSPPPAAPARSASRPAPANAAPAVPSLAEDGSLVGRRSPDGTTIEFTRPTGQTFSVYTQEPYHLVQAKVFPASAGSVEVRSVEIGWKGTGPGRMHRYRKKARCNPGYDCIGTVVSFAVAGELKAARGVRIDLNESVPTTFAAIGIWGDPVTMREMTDSAKAEMRTEYNELLAQVAGQRQLEFRVQRELRTMLDRLERNCRQEVARAKDSTAWTAL